MVSKWKTIHCLRLISLAACRLPVATCHMPAGHSCLPSEREPAIPAMLLPPPVRHPNLRLPFIRSPNWATTNNPPKKARWCNWEHSWRGISPSAYVPQEDDGSNPSRASQFFLFLHFSFPAPCTFTVVIAWCLFYLSFVNFLSFSPIVLWPSSTLRAIPRENSVCFSVTPGKVRCKHSFIVIASYKILPSFVSRIHDMTRKALSWGGAF